MRGLPHTKGDRFMKNIIYIGLDVHKEKIQACAFLAAYDFGEDRVLANIELGGNYREIIKFASTLKKKFGKETRFVCGYEAGCLGYSLCRNLQGCDIECHIMAPTTMSKEPGVRIKTDRRDAEMIARCLAYNTYKGVHLLDEEDESVRDYIRMRDDFKQMLKGVKQKILALLLRLGIRCDTCKIPWTQKHLQWLKSVDMGKGLNRETLDEYLKELDHLKDRIDNFDTRIHELCDTERYKENVKKLICFPGIKEHTALSFISEIGDFTRFTKAKSFAAFLGLVPGEQSSGSKVHRTALTKSGNNHLRRLTTEVAQAAIRSNPSYKSKALKARQEGAPEEVIAYADKARDRIIRKYKKMIRGEDILGGHKAHNVVVAAVAREMSCFICGMMNGWYNGADSDKLQI